MRESGLTRVGPWARVLARVGPWALGLGAGLWVAALLLAPAAIFPIGAFICHQRPERSFFINGSPMAVCARCAGLYAGAAAAAPLALAFASAMSSRRARRVAAIAALPTLVTWGLEVAGLAHPSNTVRALAALPLGAAVAWLILSTLRAVR